MSFTRDSIFDYTLTSERDSNLAITTSSQKREDTWDPVVGLSFSPRKTSPFLQYATQLSYPSSKARSFAWPFTMGAATVQAQLRWTEAVEEEKEAFSDTYDLYSKVLAKIWGQTSAPLPTSTATCFSCHPSEIIHYATKSEQECFLAINSELDAISFVELSLCPGCPAPEGKCYERSNTAFLADTLRSDHRKHSHRSDDRWL